MGEHRIFGIRHHGPGSARSLGAALDAWQPDCVLVGGPPEADEMVAWVKDEHLVPPVALLSHAEDAPSRAAFHPFAAFSPEWVALRWATTRGVPAAFIDLPLAHQLTPPPSAEVREAAAAPPLPSQTLRSEEPAEGSRSEASAALDEEDEGAHEETAWRRLCAIGGFTDSEALWDRLVETSSAADPTAMFAAVADLMGALREATAAAAPIPPAAFDVAGAVPPERRREAQREAHMRQCIRRALKDGAARVAVVCGAWHAPALASVAKGGSADAALLRGLPKAKVATTWVPWTYGRLAAHSGYGAGVVAPGWYHHLFAEGPRAHQRWLTEAAQVMRRHRFDVSTAHVIEAVRLAEALAALRGHAAPALPDTLEAIEAIHAEGDPLPLRFIERELLVGERMGRVPEGVPEPALARDLRATQKQVRLKPEALARDLDLDLRQDTDRARSHLLRRLRVLDIPWGVPSGVHRRTQNTFHERWHLEWKPDFAVALVEASRYGTTVASAARAALLDAGAKASDIPALAALLTDALHADCPDALPALVARLDALAAAGNDVPAWMSALATLAPTLRYGDVRKTDAQGLETVLEHYAERIAIGLPAAAAGLSEDAANHLMPLLVDADEGMGFLAETEIRAWRASLMKIAHADTTHPLIAGRATRLLLAHGTLDAAGVALLLGQALSPGVAAGQARWLEGLLAGGGGVLLHEPELLALIDAWLQALPAETFDAILPLVRRAFSLMEKPERRQVGEALFEKRAATAESSSPALDPARAARLMQVLTRCLGRVFEAAP